MKKCLAMVKDIAELYMKNAITKEDLKPTKKDKFKQLMLQPAAEAAAGVSQRPAAAKVLKRPAAAEVSPRPAAAKVLKRPAAAATAAAAAAAEVSPRPAAAEVSKRPAAPLPPSRQLLKRRATAFAQGSLGCGEEEEEVEEEDERATAV